jgi:peptidyl-prolyl cis-trans isomerase SurA
MIKAEPIGNLIRLGGLAVAFFLILALAAASPEARANVDRIVAVVNGEVITKKQLDAKMNRIPPAQRAAMKGKVLDAMIDQELMNQAAKAKGVFVTESDVSTALEIIKKENKLTDAQFRASLTHSGTTVEAFREDLRFELLRNRVIGAQIMSKIVITDSEVRAFLRGEGPDLGSMGGPPGDTRPVRMIIIPLDPRNKAKSMGEGRKIKDEIEKGLDFAAAAKKYSKGPGRDKGGDPGDGATVAQLPPEMQQALFKKGSGQPIDPVEAGNAVVIIAALGDAPVPPPAPEPSRDKKKKGKEDPDEFTAEAKESARRQLERYKMQQRYSEWVKDLKRNAIIRVNL